MAEAIISMLIEQLDFLTQESIKEVRLIAGFEKQVDNLRSNLEAIQDVLVDAERRRVTEITVRAWLENLGDLLYDMDDVLDKWFTLIHGENFDREKGETSVLEEEEEDDDDDDDDSTLSAKKFHQIGLPARHTHNFACKIKELNERLDDIASEKRIYDFNKAKMNEKIQQEAISFVDLSQVYDRDKEKQVLISKLLSESSEDGIVVDVIPMVGAAGIGKTTLAQLAYNDYTVEARFEKRMWIHVSEPFNEIRVANEIVESLEGCAFNLFSMKSLLHRIHGMIEGMRFLLVLDNVSIEDATKWEPLKAALDNGATGSKILVTTRKMEVVTIMRAGAHTIPVEPLAEEVCWSTFSRLAFFGRERCDQLEEIGKRIVAKSKGVPLVVKLLGNLLRFKNGQQQWEDVLHSKLWDAEDAKVNALVPFLLSYNDFPSVEKRCLLYCSILPKDFKIDEGSLIEMWMSQGYLGRNKNTDSEQLGRDCFENLAMRCFFHEFEKDYDGNVIGCKIHDVIHDFIKLLTENECCVMDLQQVKENKDQAKEKTRHATLLLDSETGIPRSIYENKCLRTLFVTSSKWLNDISYELYSSLTCLRTLNLSHNTIEKLPEGIDKLIHLRYLNLSHNSLMELPKSLCGLVNLQTLRVNQCHSLELLPREMEKLINLRHLYIDGCERLHHLPKGIVKITHLRTLDMFVVPHYDNNEALKLEDLSTLKRLQWHSIHILGCFHLQNAEREQLKDKELADLKLTFYSVNHKGGEKVLDALQVRPGLKSLEIKKYYGETIGPNWLTKLINLKRLSLNGCSNCESLPPLGKLSSLEFLSLEKLGSVKKLGLEFLGIDNDNVPAKKGDRVSFPKLKSLHFRFLSQWREWKGINMDEEEEEDSLSATIMPCLQILEISFCLRIEALPDYLKTTPLQHLTINCCRTLQKRCREGVGKDWLKISHVPIIRINECFNGEGNTSSSDCSDSETSQHDEMSPANDE